MKKLNLAFSALMLSICAAHAHEATLGNITVSAPWALPAQKGNDVGAAYITIKNAGTLPDRLVSISSPVATHAEFHDMTTEGTVMKMRPLKNGIVIPAGTTVQLKSGGMHIMFIGLKDALVEGKDFPTTLTFEKAGQLNFNFHVKTNGGASSHASH